MISKDQSLAYITKQAVLFSDERIENKKERKIERKTTSDEKKKEKKRKKRRTKRGKSKADFSQQYVTFI